MSAVPSLLLPFPDDPLLVALRPAWVAAGQSLVDVDLDPTAPGPALRSRLREAVGAVAGPAVIVGFSRGARLAVEVADAAGLVGIVALGFPFHRRGDPADRPGLDALRRVAVPTLVVQGTRDAHGSAVEVPGYDLPPTVRLLWLEDGNHRFEPRERAAATLEDHLAGATAATLAFVQEFAS